MRKLDEFFYEKLERGRRLLAESEAHKGSADLQKFIQHGDLNMRLQELLLNDALEPRQGLSTQDKQQAMVVLLLDSLCNLPTGISFSMMQSKCFDAANSLACELSRSADPVSMLLGKFCRQALLAEAVLNRHGLNDDLLPVALEEAGELVELLPDISVVAEVFEYHQRQAGFCPAISALQLRTLPLIWQLTAAHILSICGPSQQLQQYREVVLAAVQQLLHLSPDTNAAYLHWMRGDMLADERPATRAVASFHAALRCAEQEKAHLVSLLSRVRLTILLATGALQPRWSLSEVQQLVQASEHDFALVKQWLPRASLASTRQQLSSQSELVKVAAAELAKCPARQAELLRTMGLPAAAWNPTLSLPQCDKTDLCGGCGHFALQMRKCRACQAVKYCCRECQRHHWQQGGHKQECSRLAASSTTAAEGGQTAADAAGAGSSNSKAMRQENR